MARRDTDTRPVPSRPSIPGRGRRGGCRCAPPAPSASPFSCPARAGHPGSPLPTGSRRSAPRLRTRPVPNGARGTGRRIDEHDLRCHTCPPRTHIHGRPVRLERRSRGRRRCALPRRHRCARSKEHVSHGGAETAAQIPIDQVGDLAGAARAEDHAFRSADVPEILHRSPRSNRRYTPSHADAACAGAVAHAPSERRRSSQLPWLVTRSRKRVS
jgi:hypothetical protein